MYVRVRFTCVAFGEFALRLGIKPSSGLFIHSFQVTRNNYINDRQTYLTNNFNSSVGNRYTLRISTFNSNELEKLHLSLVNVNQRGG